MRIFFAAALALCLSASALAQSPYLVTDLKMSVDATNGSRPYYLAAVGRLVYFVANPSTEKAGLWVTDGTKNGTFRLMHLNARGNELGVTGFTASGDRFYFGARAGGQSWAIWRTDGTLSGTTALVTSDTHVAPAHLLGETLVYFRANHRELWAAGANGTRQLAASLRGGSAQFNSLLQWKNALFIGTEESWWKTDGTAEGTARILEHPVWSQTVMNDRLFFTGSRPETGGELWTSDGSEAGTRLVADLRPGPDSTFTLGSSLRSLNDRLLFLGKNGEIGTSDGTAAGTRVLRTGRSDSRITVHGGIGYFVHDDLEHGLELWRSDGTDSGTRMVVEMWMGAPEIDSITAGASKIFFYGNGEAFESDGTAAGTRVLPAPRDERWLGARESGSRTMITIGDTLFYSASDGVRGAEPWVYGNGESRMISNLNAETPGSSRPRNLSATSERLFFTATVDGVDKLFSTNGADDTRVVLDAAAEPLVANGRTMYLKSGGKLLKSDGLTIEQLGAFNEIHSGHLAGGRLYVVATDATARSLWAIDGAATRLTREDVHVRDVAVVAERLYFSSSNNVLYTTDGTVSTTRPVGSWAGGLHPLRGSVVSLSEKKLRKFSGTSVEIIDVPQLPGEETSASFRSFASIGTHLLFTVWQSATPVQLWKTDGTAAGTMKVADVAPFNNWSSVTPLVSIGDRVAFATDDGVHGLEAWVSDGTAEGTKLLRDISPFRELIDFEFFAVDGIAYFGALSADTGWELWKTDGSTAGTHLIADIAPGPDSWSSPGDFERMADTLYFAASHDDYGRELWALPLHGQAAVGAEDVRVLRGARTAVVPIRLTRPSNRRVTVSYRTIDDSATAGREYTAASGTVTFEPWQTLKPIEIELSGTNGGTTRVFLVTIASADAALVRPAGAVILSDVATQTDLAVSLRMTATQPIVTVTNHGPAVATHMVLCIGTAKASFTVPTAYTCDEPRALNAGETISKPVANSSDVLTAKVTYFGPDLNESNNQMAWSISERIAIEPAVPHAGITGKILIGHPATTAAVQLRSGDPSVLSVPATMTPVDAESSMATFTAHASGHTTIEVTSAPAFGFFRSVRVDDAGPRRLPALMVKERTADWRFGRTNSIFLDLRGIEPGGKRPTGTVSFSSTGAMLGSLPVTGELLAFRTSALKPGRYTIVVRYSGDQYFEDEGDLEIVTVAKGRPSLQAVRVDGSKVMAIVGGVPGRIPTGTVNGQPLVNGTVTLTDVAADATTLRLSYSGDDWYDPSSATVPIKSQKQRSARH